MFIVSKRNFLVKRADGTDYLIPKEYIGEIPEDVAGSTVVQGALKSGLISTPETKKDKDIDAAIEKKPRKA